MKVRWLDRRIARPGPYLTLCLSAEEFAQAMRDLSQTELPKWVNDGADAKMHTLENHEGSVSCVVCLRHDVKRTGVEIAGLIVHEAVHVWQAYCRAIGEHSPGSEQEAYGIQAIAQELLAEFAARLCAKPRRAR